MRGLVRCLWTPSSEAFQAGIKKTNHSLTRRPADTPPTWPSPGRQTADPHASHHVHPPPVPRRRRVGARLARDAPDAERHRPLRGAVEGWLPDGSGLSGHGTVGSSQRDLWDASAVVSGGVLVLQRHRGMRRWAGLLLVCIWRHHRLQEARRRRAARRQAVPVRAVCQRDTQQAGVAHGQSQGRPALAAGLDALQPLESAGHGAHL